MILKLLTGMSIIICSNLPVFSQTTAPKKLNAQRLTGTIKLDGNLDETAWKDAPVANNFVEWRPSAGTAEANSNRTEVYVLYDNNAIYVGGYCHEQTGDSVSRELVGRDQVGANDFVGIIFDTYNDKINASGFYVTALGEQYDAKYSNTGGEDGSWNAVWDSKAHIVKDGWTFEMRIPYSALRFSKNTTEWGMNISRKRNKAGKQYMWNPVVPTINGFVNQEGLWTGISDIKPPVRLAFSPYLSSYVNHYPAKGAASNGITASVNGGMDVKYGINQNYTLDMTLIPDFGQVQSDKEVLNLTPFEVKYNENRAFFTEGTELFNKGNLFYSRRIGGAPIHKYDVNPGPNEKITDNPSETKLINATKISGRNQKGLGIGLFNAITKSMYAEVQDITTKEIHEVQTSPQTNYNIIVFDLTLKNNSSVSLVNTNVLREGKDYDANVTAFVFDIYNKKNIYNWYGQTTVSNKSASGTNTTGYSHSLGFAKTGGRFNFNLNQDMANIRFDKNDMGILFNNNYIDHYLWLGYKWIKPKSFYNRLYLNINNNLSHRFEDGAYQSLNVNANINGQLKNLWNAGIEVYHNSVGHDFYEPRKQGRVFNTSQSTGTGFWIYSNTAKKYYLGGNLSGTFKKLFAGKNYYAGIEQRYRFNNKLSVSQNVSYTPAINAVGFAGFEGNEVVFNRRNRNTVENGLGIKYNFSTKSGLTLNARHYWSAVESQQYYTLQPDGSLSENNSFNKNSNYNVNLFNIDMVYTWQFATGSFMYIVWKNNIQNTESADGYFKNLGNTLGTMQNNNLSIKILYYLDYLKIRKRV